MVQTIDGARVVDREVQSGLAQYLHAISDPGYDSIRGAEALHNYETQMAHADAQQGLIGRGVLPNAAEVASSRRQFAKLGLFKPFRDGVDMLDKDWRYLGDILESLTEGHKAIDTLVAKNTAEGIPHASEATRPEDQSLLQYRVKKAMAQLRN